jgi:hypothetical protein
VGEERAAAADTECSEENDRENGCGSCGSAPEKIKKALIEAHDNSMGRIDSGREITHSRGLKFPESCEN